uniref:Uncharacterized protein n=1 Tax=Amphora coffeiformis TaxID=265554 RepID=A0A7S3L845_9STRA|mmetsp:Transcript_14777/g.27998  ORF Transcript_14777/g.27998 Transcript_14777/m.27998 type:complete len:132 (+) Transcript_14777:264-659(+)
MTPNEEKQEVARMINTNNRGTHRVLQIFDPLLQNSSPGPRFIIVVSSFDTLAQTDPELQDSIQHGYHDIGGSREIFDNLHDERTTKYSNGEENGWLSWMNIPSKVFRVAAMRVWAQEWSTKTNSTHQPFGF